MVSSILFADGNETHCSAVDIWLALADLIRWVSGHVKLRLRSEVSDLGSSVGLDPDMSPGLDP